MYPKGSHSSQGGQQCCWPCPSRSDSPSFPPLLAVSTSPSPCPHVLTGADPLLVPQAPHLKQTLLCPRLSCWDGHGLQRQQIQSPGEGPSGHGQQGGQAELTPQTTCPPTVGPPQVTLTLLSVTVCCSQIIISSMLGTHQHKLGRVTVAARQLGGSDRLWILFAAAGPFLNPTSGCNKEQQQN